MSGGTFAGSGRVHHVLPRYAAMAGIHISTSACEYTDADSDVEIPMGAVQKIMALDFAERATADLRALGEGMGKLKIPANINVWQHLKGELSITHAASALEEAVKAMTEKLSS